MSSYDSRASVKEIEAVDDYVLPEPGPFSFDEAQEFIEEYGDEYGIYVACTCGIFERAWFVRGFPNPLSDFYQHPRLAERLLDKVLDYRMKEVNSLIANLDMDFLLFGYDYGTQLDTIMSPEMWRKFIKPRLTRVIRRIRSSGHTRRFAQLRTYRTFDSKHSQ